MLNGAWAARLALLLVMNTRAVGLAGHARTVSGMIRLSLTATMTTSQRHLARSAGRLSKDGRIVTARVIGTVTNAAT